MANCPNCGSGHIQLKQETDVNWGNAIAGYALFGVVGAAVGAVTGEDRNVNACLDCGKSWKAEDLFKLLQIIKDCTGAKLNLARERDRLFMDNFLFEMGSYLEEIPNIERKANQLIADAEEEAKKKIVDEGAKFGCGFLTICLGSVITFFILSSLAQNWILTFFVFLILLLPTFFGLRIISNSSLVNERLTN